jgi:Transglutaminase-like superfamily
MGAQIPAARDYESGLDPTTHTAPQLGDQRRRWPQASGAPWHPAAQALLRWAGLPADLRLGVRRAGSAIEAHAWVESGAWVVGQVEDYSELRVPLAGTRGIS